MVIGGRGAAMSTCNVTQAGVPAQSVRASSACSKQLSSSAWRSERPQWGAGLNCRAVIETGPWEAAEHFANCRSPICSAVISLLEIAVYPHVGQNISLLILSNHVLHVASNANLLHLAGPEELWSVVAIFENWTHACECAIFPSSPFAINVNPLNSCRTFISSASCMRAAHLATSPILVQVDAPPPPSFWCVLRSLRRVLALSWNVSPPQARPAFISPHLLIINTDPNGSCSSLASKVWHAIILTPRERVCACAFEGAYSCVSCCF